MELKANIISTSNTQLFYSIINFYGKVIIKNDLKKLVAAAVDTYMALLKLKKINGTNGFCRK